MIFKYVGALQSLMGHHSFTSEEWSVGEWGNSDDVEYEYNPTLEELTLEGIRLANEIDEPGEFTPGYVKKNGRYHPDHYLRIGHWDQVMRFLGIWEYGRLEYEERPRLTEKLSRIIPGWEPPGTETPKRTEKYGSDWLDIRDNIVDRDGGQCRICGTEEGLRRLDVHHIKPAQTFDSPDNGMNDPDNLITLCNSCHGSFEGRHTDSTHEEFEELVKKELQDE